MDNFKIDRTLISSLIAGASGGAVIASFFTATSGILMFGAVLGLSANLAAILSKKKRLS